MKRTLLFLIILCSFFDTSAQIYQPIPGYGFAWNRIRPDSVLHLPSSADTSLRTNLLTRPQIRQIGDSTWAFSGSRWFNLNRQIDTSSLGSTYLKIADTSAFSNRFVTIYGDSQIIYSKKIFDPTMTAAGKIARSTLIKGLLTAAADSDTLIGLEVKPDFNNGIRTGVRNFGIRSLNDNVIGSMRTYASGNTYFGASPQSTADAGYKVDVNGTLRAQGVFYGSQLYTGAHSFRDQMYITATNDGWTKSNSYNPAGAYALSFIGDLRFASTSTIKSVFSFNGSYSNNGTIYGGEMSLMKLWTGDAFGQPTIPVAGQSQYGLNIMPTLNYTASTSNFTGIYYNPTLTSTTGLTHLAMDLVSGDVKIRPLAGAGTRMATVSSTGVLGVTALPYTIAQVDSADALRVRGNSVQGRVAYWGGANQITGNSAFIWDTATLRLGIGTAAAPLAPIHVGNQNYNSSVDAQILISRTIANERTGNAHSFSDASRFVRAGGVAFNSFDARIEIAGANNYDHYVAFQHAPSNNATGTITYMSGLSSLLYQNAGTITHNSAVYVMNPFGVGAITNNYGMLIEPLTRGTNNFGVHSSVAAGNRRWNFYAAGTARNLFTGITHIGDTTTYDGSPNLSVTGKAWISDSLRAGVTTIGNLSSTGVQRFNRGTLTFLINPSFGGANNYSQLQASSTLTIATGGDFNRLAIDGTHGNVAIGSVVTSFDDRLLSITKPFVGSATTRYGIYQNNTVNSNLSNVAINNSSLLTTQAASFNLTHAWHYDAAGISRGAGSTITNQYGFYARDFSEATNNMGFVGMLSSGANKWNFYASGTANNYFNGNTLIGTLSNPDNYKLIVSGGSTFGAFVSSSNYRLNAPNLGNWDIRYGFFGSGGTDRGGFGGYGSSDSLKSYYIGASYSDAIVRFDSAIKKTDFFGRVVGTSDAVFTGGGVTAQRGNFTSLRLNKDSVAITNTNVWGARIDTTNGNLTRQLLSGSYTPTITAVTNVASSTSNVCFWSRTGNMVTVTGYLEVDPTAGSTATEFRLSLPITTNMTGGNSGKVAGTMAGLDGAAAGSILADIAGNRASFRYTTPVSAANMGLSFTFSYLIE